jgi:chitodextrinase
MHVVDWAVNRPRLRPGALLCVSLACVLVPALVSAQTGPVAAYAMNETSGTTLTDSSGNNNTGTLMNGPVWTAAGKNGGALQFDGSNDLVRVNDSSSLDLSAAATFEAWVYPTAAPSGWRTIVQKEADAWFFTASSGGGNQPATGGTFAGNCCTVVTAVSALAASTWTHVAATYDGAQLRVFINGTQVASTPRTGTYEVNANPLWIGGNALYGENFQGRLDDLRIYARALSAAEIQTDMNTPVGPAVPDTTPPAAPTGLTATAASHVQINLGWNAATDNVGVTGYQVFRDSVQVGTTSTLSYSDVGLLPSTLYTYTLKAVDAAGNVSPFSASASALTLATPPVDGTPPTATLTAPPASTVLGTITVSATASDNVGVAGVQFLLDGASLGAEDLTSPYSLSWNTTTAASGPHTLSARARDAVGNLGTSAGTAVVVDNLAPTGTVSINNGAAATNNRNTTLTLAGTDAHSAVTQMRFSNNGTSYSAAEAYATTKAWTLTVGAGTKTVYVQFKDAPGNWSGAFTDTIVLDTTAPTISAVVGSGLTTSTATITWTTNEAATSQVNYGLTTSYGSTTPLDATLVTAHTVILTGLAAQTTYNYRARSLDAAGNERVGTNATFTTLAGPDTTPPSVPLGLTATAASSTRINLAWSASTDNVGVSGYHVFRGGTQVATAITNSYADTGLSPSTAYTYAVRAYDAAGNTSALSATASATTLAPPDSVPPQVSITFPASGAQVNNIVTVTAAASDNVGVAGVRFLIDGVDRGEDVDAPYAYTWDTRAATSRTRPPCP